MTIRIENEGPKMLNYKFRIIRSSPRMLVDLAALSALFASTGGDTRWKASTGWGIDPEYGRW